ncbi:MAG: hypothetical protein Q7S40_19680 [Opitutaceae bacterium]|nr:hypothetical protein [Opitutaceae bacterium]
MTEFDQRRIVKLIGDAFVILCVRVGGGSAAERKLRLGFEAILRQLGTTPLQVIASFVPLPGRHIGASTGDLRQIVRALDQCLAVFQRYASVLNPDQRRTQELIGATREFAEQELQARDPRSIGPMAAPAIQLAT